jgi:hypothetical protein
LDKKLPENAAKDDDAQGGPVNLTYYFFIVLVNE